MPAVGDAREPSVVPGMSEASANGGFCIPVSCTLQSSIALESSNLDTDPRLGTSRGAGSRMQIPHPQSQSVEDSKLG